MSNPSPNPSNPNLLTNILLVIIAGLLLVQVIQTGLVQNQAQTYPGVVINNPQTSMPGEPQVQKPPMMASDMIFSALKAFPAGCEGKAVLADCGSPAAEEAKMQIRKFEESGQGPRQIFDSIVKTWGEKVLTQQALDIRRARAHSKH